MIIDLILDRKEGTPYSPEKFYRNLHERGYHSERIQAAMDSGFEFDVKAEIVRYLIDNEYDVILVAWVESLQWLVPDSGNVDDMVLHCRNIEQWEVLAEHYRKKYNL